MAKTKTPSLPVFDSRERLRWAIDALRQPASGDPRFSSPDTIAEHLDDFVVEVHTTWKRIQVEAITHIMGIETRPG